MTHNRKSGSIVADVEEAEDKASTAASSNRIKSETKKLSATSQRTSSSRTNKMKISPSKEVDEVSLMKMELSSQSTDRKW